jgi:hypothetical protein
VARLPAPAIPFLKPIPLTLHRRPDGSGLRIEIAMSAPSTTDDGWWLGILWAQDDEGVVELERAASPAGVPPSPPLFVLGPAFAGALSGFVAEEGGRQALRIRLPPADPPDRAWSRPTILQVALRWDPVRAATMTPNELARTILEAFGRALSAAGAPGRVVGHG